LLTVATFTAFCELCYF